MQPAILSFSTDRRFNIVLTILRFHRRKFIVGNSSLQTTLLIRHSANSSVILPHVPQQPKQQKDPQHKQFDNCFFQSFCS